MLDLIDFKYLDLGKDKLNSQRHSHGPSYEILFIRNGGGNVIIRDRLLPLRSGAVFFINGAETHCTVPEAPEKYLRSKIIISANFLDDISSAPSLHKISEALFIKGGGSCFIPDPADAELCDAEFSAMKRIIDQDGLGTLEHAEVGIAASILSIMFAAYRAKSSDMAPIANKISDVLSYISEHLCERITLDDICRHEHISKYYLCHDFKKKVGMTLFDYILSRRLSLARSYLQSTDLTVSEISQITGFSDVAYFCKAFKENENMTPTEFRKGQKKS